jgi:hypothetical protein
MIQMFLMIYGIPQSCFEAAMIWCQVKIEFEDLKRYRESIARVSWDVRNNQTQPGMCWREVKDVMDDITNRRGAGMGFLAMD